MNVALAGDFAGFLQSNHDMVALVVAVRVATGDP